MDNREINIVQAAKRPIPLGLSKKPENLYIENPSESENIIKASDMATKSPKKDAIP